MDPTSDSRVDLVAATTTRELRQLGTGMSLGRYTLIRKVATGGMAEVYAARSHGISGFEKKVAIKKILPQFSLNRRFVDMLVDEAKIAVSLTHPNIAQIYELGLEGETYYIVMEYVDGRPLNRLMQRLDQDGGRTVPIEHAAHIMAEVAKGLHHAHTQKDARGRALNIVHRDVSPQNVLLSHTGDVKLIDFGIARAAGRAAQTTAGTIKGKLRYLAPEIARGEEPDARADIYCCGIVLFEMLTGEALFAPRTDLEAIELATAARVRAPSASNPKVPSDLEDIVMCALERQRDDRYQSAKDLYTQLRRFLNQHYPAYVGSELGDVMSDVFAADIAEDRRLDALAEEVIDRLSDEERDETLGVQDGELAGLLERRDETKPGRYKAVVTRTGIEIGETAASAEPTQKAQNPLLEVPEDSVSELPPRRASGATDPVVRRRPTAGEDPEERVVRDPRFAILYATAAIVIVLLGLWVGFASVRPPPEPPIAPRTEGPRPATVVVRVRPEVPFDVVLDGTPVRAGAIGAVTFGAVAPEVEHIFVIIAAGHREARLIERFEPGVERALEVELAPVLGTVVLKGAEGARVELSAGRLEGDRVVAVPFGALELKVVREGVKDWSHTVSVDSEAPVEVEVPPAAPVPVKKGTLFVNAWPKSEVLINGRSQGHTPVSVKLPAQTYRVVLKRPDGSSVVRKATVVSGRETKLTMRWAK